MSYDDARQVIPTRCSACLGDTSFLSAASEEPPLKVVGDKLRDVALQSTVPNEENLFGRSAFNRYYYSAFLITRSLMRRRREEWGRVSHASMPEVVRKARKEILDSQLKMVKKGISSGGITSDTKEGAIAAAALATLLEEAYGIRVKADYFPEELVHRRRDELLFCSTNLSDAMRWSAKAQHFCNQIEYAWHQLGLI